VVVSPQHSDGTNQRLSGGGQTHWRNELPAAGGTLAGNPDRGDQNRPLRCDPTFGTRGEKVEQKRRGAHRAGEILPACAAAQRHSGNAGTHRIPKTADDGGSDLSPVRNRGGGSLGGRSSRHCQRRGLSARD